MSTLFEYEKNLESEIAEHLSNAGIKSTRSSELTNLGADNVQIALQYQGAMNEHRQLVDGFQEYDTHDATVIIQCSTFRDHPDRHHQRLGKIRSLMLNSNVGFSKQYTVFDIMPETTQTVLDEENNLDQSQLSFSIKFKTNLKNF